MNYLVGRQAVGTPEGRDACSAIHSHVAPRSIRIARDLLAQEGSHRIRGTWVDADPERRPVGFGRDEYAGLGLQPGDGYAVGTTTSGRSIRGRLWTVDQAEFRLPETPKKQDGTMREDHVDTQQDAQDAREDYVAPTLTDLGSFQELTQINGSSVVDAEGQS
jgi:hypothetical protein